MLHELEAELFKALTALHLFHFTEDILEIWALDDIEGALQMLIVFLDKVFDARLLRVHQYAWREAAVITIRKEYRTTLHLLLWIIFRSHLQIKEWIVKNDTPLGRITSY